jgi:GWxTD domain-containing protein
MNVRVFAASCLALGLFQSAAICFQSSKLRKELESPYKKWFQEDVAYIISSEERQAWRHLATDEEREQFIEQFWLRRDPTPDTVENEFKEEHYRRIAYANQRYASGIPGWKSDRGRIYITYGPPDEIEDHSSGGTYQRPQEQGGGTTSVYPFQQWRYRYIDGIGTNVVVEFVDPTMTGEFRMTMDPSEKNALAHVPTGPRMVSFPPVWQQPAVPARQQGITFSALELNAQLHRPPVIKFPDLEAQIESVIKFNILPMQVHAEYLPLSESSVRTNITVQIENKDLLFQGKNGGQKAVVNLYGRITTMSRRVVNVFEDTITVDAPEVLLAELIKKSSLYQKSFTFAPGQYRLNVVVRDVVSGNMNNYELALNVPRF